MNDIVAIGPESFEATNDHLYPSDAIDLIALILGLPWCDVIYYSTGYWLYVCISTYHLTPDLSSNQNLFVIVIES